MWYSRSTQNSLENEAVYFLAEALVLHVTNREYCIAFCTRLFTRGIIVRRLERAIPRQEDPRKCSN